MKNFVLTGLALIGLAGNTNAQSPRSGQVPYPFGYNQPFRAYGQNSPYQGGYDRYGSYWGRTNQGYNLPRYAPPGFPSQVYPSYQPYLNPYRPYGRPYGNPYWLPNPYYFPR